MDTQDFPPFVPEIQENPLLALTYPQDAEIHPRHDMRYVLVDEQDMVAASMIARAKAIKEGKAHDTGGLKLAK
jgi:hypothetical protein